MTIEKNILAKISLPILLISLPLTSVGGLAFQNIGLKAPYLISSLGFVILFLFSFKNLKSK